MKDYILKLLPRKKSKCLKTAELTCVRCGNKFTVPFWMVKKGRQFCSQKCRPQDPLKTLLSRVEKTESGCWNYTGTIGWGGYGQIKVLGTHWSAHKLMWVLHNKMAVPEGMVVRHTCIGNRCCINPDHLILGTQKDNVQDMIKQGRFRIAIGVERKYAALTEDQVRQIRALRQQNLKRGESEWTYKRLAAMFGVKDGTMWQVVNFKSYKTVS